MSPPKESEFEAESESYAKAYPNVAKLLQTHAERFAIMGFLEWLEEKGFHVASEFETYARANATGNEKRAVYNHNEALLFAYLEIDKRALETERRTILENHRKENRL